MIEKNIMGLSWRNWVNWRYMGINFLISLSIAIPLFLLKDYISNLYIRVAVIGMIYAIWVVFLQIKSGIFIFGDKLNFLKNL